MLGIMPECTIRLTERNMNIGSPAIPSVRQIPFIIVQKSADLLALQKLENKKKFVNKLFLY